MTQRLSKLAQYLFSDSYEMAVELHQKAVRGSIDQPEEVQLLLAKAYFATQNYQTAADIASRLKVTRNPKIAYESHFLEFKALYLKGASKVQILQSLKTKLKATPPTHLAKYLKQIDEALSVVSFKGAVGQMAKSTIGRSERRQFEQLMKAEDDNSIVMQGMPMFLVSQKWFQSWEDYTSNGDKFQKEKEYPGPITQFDIVDHLYNIFFDGQSHKDYTNRYLLANCAYKLLPKKCWNFLKDKYGGIQVKRYNISFIDKPYEIITEVNLKRIEIARLQKAKAEQLSFLFVQITKKENWEGLRGKLAIQWGPGQICYYDGKGNKAVTQSQNFEEIDTLGKRYTYVLTGKTQVPLKQSKIEKCGNKRCQKTGDLRNCQCKTIKFCNLQCLKQEWKDHKNKHELQLQHLRRKPATFKEFNLEQKEYGGRKGVVGLKNLGNTCYMNSGLQCLSNTKEITDYFMKDDFKSHINHSNPLGTKGNLACAYAELIREMWTGSSESVAPVKLKKKIGDFATQFSGYGQQDSQEFISYLIDGLQEDLNLVKKKQNFQASDEIRPDEQMSKQSEYNFSKRIQSYIRNLMVGQFKSTVVCSTCAKISVCFDPYMLLSLPIPSNRQWSFFFVSSTLEKGALKIMFNFSSTSTLQSLVKQFARTYNENYYKEIKEGVRQKLVDDRVFFFTINAEKFEITKVLLGNQSISSIFSGDYLFFMQVPVTSTNDQLLLCEYQLNSQRCSYPRMLKLPKNVTPTAKDALILKSLERGQERSASKSSYQELVVRQRLTKIQNVPFKSIVVECRRKLKLSTFVEGYNQGFARRLVQADQAPVNLEDCLRGFTHREKLEKENSWYCNKCKEFKQATKQMEIYKTNKILVMAFKRFNRHSKITLNIKFPIEGMDIGPYVLSNRNKQPLLYDLYGVVNHHGSLYGGHYTAYCQNFLNKRWYEFNDSRVSQISKSEIVSGYAYVLFFRRRDR